MNSALPNEVKGVGFLAKALSEAILDGDYVNSVRDLLTGLGLLGLHLNIQQALVEYEKMPKANQ